MARHHDTLRMSMSCSILRRHIGGGEQAALGAHLHRHRARADAVQDLLRQAFRHHAARRGIEHQRGGVRGGQAVVEPVEPEIGDRRHVDENFRHHHEQDGEEQQLAGKADARAARAGRGAVGATGSLVGSVPGSNIASTENSQPSYDAPHPRARQTRREKVDGRAFADFRQRRIGQHDAGEGADIQALRDRQGPGRDQFAGLRADDGGA